jgi:large subunit ribosomal protein L23
MILKRPHLTEKSSDGSSQHKYAFVVDQIANKVEIKKEIAKRYQVIVEAVNTLRQRGKKKVRHIRKRAIKGQQSHFKKAIVTLRKGDMIDVHADMTS